MMALLLSPLGRAGMVALVLIGAYLGFQAWLSAHDANVLSGYVLLSEKTALQAQLDRERQLRAAAERASTEAAKRAETAARLRSETQAALEARIAADTAEDGAVWTEGDLKWLRAR